MSNKSHDGIGTKLLKIFSVLGATVIIVPTLLSLGFGEDPYSIFLISFMIGFPILGSYFWINDSRRGKAFYAGVVPMLLILGLIFILILTLGGFSAG